MKNKVQKIKEFLIGMAGAACCDAKTKKNIEKNILPFVDSLQEEPVSEGLKETAWNYADKKCHLDIAVFTPDEIKKERGKMQFTWQDLYDAVMLGAKWQKEQDQSTIELAEDHAMLAGMEKMKEQMMAKAIDGEVLENCDGKVLEYDDSILDEKLSDCKVFDKVKIIVIKGD